MRIRSWTVVTLGVSVFFVGSTAGCFQTSDDAENHSKDAETDGVAEDTYGKDEGVGARDSHSELGADTGEMDTADTTACDGTWKPVSGGSERCCPIGEHGCEMFQFEDVEGASAFDPSSMVWTVVYDGSAVRFESSSLSGTIQESSGSGEGSGQTFFEEGTIEGDRIRFDLSDLDLGENDDVVIDSLSFTDVCGEGDNVSIGTQLEHTEDTVQRGFSCSEPPGF